MAALEKIRVKMGAFITALIAIALLSFIINPDTLQQTLSMFSSKYDVGEINGKGIPYQEFQKKVDEYTKVFQLTSSRDINTEESREVINQIAWQSEITNEVIVPTIIKSGITVGSDEMYDLTQGENISPVLMGEATFRDPNTGQFSKESLSQFINFMLMNDGNGDFTSYWNYLESNIYNDQMFAKYLLLLEKSHILNPIELRDAITENNTMYDVDFVLSPVGFSIDSSINVSQQEIADYYQKHKHNFKQKESRDIEYAVFEVVPSSDDINYAENQINNVYGEFTSAENQKTFLARNSDVQFNPYYFKIEELESFSPVLADFAKDAKVGDLLPPFNDEYIFTAAKVLDVKRLPDSVFVKHILLQGELMSKADSLMNVLEKGGDFTEIATQYSADKNTNVEEVGDLGWITQQASIPGFESALFAKKGDLLKLETQYGTHLVKIKDVTKQIEKRQLAILVKEAVASEQTYSNFYAKANDLVTKAGGDINKFNDAARELNVPIYPSYKMLPNARTLSSYQNTREISRWATENEVGSVSPIITVDNKYFFVVGLTAKHEEGEIPLSDISEQIKSLIYFDKSGEKLAQELSSKVGGASNINDVAEKLGLTVSSQNGITFSSLASQQTDPKFIGAVAAAQPSVLVGPVVGDIGVYYFTIKEKSSGAFYTEDDAKKREFQMFSQMVSLIPDQMMDKAEVVDQRYKFY